MTAPRFWQGADRVWDPQALVPAVAESLALRYGAQFRALGPVWLRSDPARWLWLGGPLAVLIAAAPSPVLRVPVAVTAAVGVGLGLKWQSAVEAHRDRSDAYVDALAGQVASVLVVVSGVATAMGALGELHEDVGEYEKALDYAAKAHALHITLGDVEGVANSAFLLGKLAFGRQERRGAAPLRRGVSLLR